ncbi:P-loop containing nucleoside triphosphate hydrolase protein [Lasiosphaeria miniovina]|uniref:Origin recognition complex subunit 1 n=1 Tax=Lasiosphaeria miniovina TaxID=1954250 RepID=A0AA40BG42_9PEZI|nr:P-loop containing nucleoside triphosphate hydrolase protein [Lasiosphaeria miniovina]KAK0733600.1 P-loop containing nucleoside triphosphate hydrolase protein [Lasiosphaeria miniovina]
MVSPGGRHIQRRQPKHLPGVSREDSDDELGTDDHPWEWIYEPREQEASASAEPDPQSVEGETPASSRKRKRALTQRHKDLRPKIIGARMGDFECQLGDTVLLKAEGSNEAWVGIIYEFLHDEIENEKTANFMWFSSEKENELYMTTNFDVNPLAAINGKAHVMSPAVFSQKYPTGKLPRKSKEYGKVFICRRGCNSKTCTYTDEFVWEDIYRGEDDIEAVRDLVDNNTKATRSRRRQPAKDESPERDFALGTVDKDDDDDAEFGSIMRTPKKRRTRDVAVTPTSGRRGVKGGSKPATPSSQRRILVKKHLEFTPLATRFLSPQHVQSSPYQLARTQLHVASVPTSLPCREAEFSLVYSHLEAAITDGTGTCIYISGTPGTGKTATVREVVSHLDGAVRADELDDFIFVEINGMKITDPHQAYSLLWEALKGQRVSPAQALDLLEREFSHPSPRRVPCVVLMDELDQLVTKNQGVMYNFFNWPGLRHSRLIVLAVANTMDLPERTLSNKISSRLGLTRITFPGYNHEQLMRIVQSRLEGVPGNIVDADAVQFAARKVAAVSGDARRALDICRRAVELAEADAAKYADQPPATPSKRATAGGSPLKKGSSRQQQQQQDEEEAAKTGKKTKKKDSSSAGRVTIETVRRAINEATSNPLQLYLRALPFASRLLLAALLLRTQRTGLAESSFGDVLEELQRVVRMLASRDVSRPLTLLLRPSSGPHSGAAGTGADLLTATTKQSDSVARQMVHPAGLSAAAVDLAGAGIVNLEAHKAERPSKMRLAVGDEEVRLAFRDDPEIKALGVVL